MVISNQLSDKSIRLPVTLEMRLVVAGVKAVNRTTLDFTVNESNKIVKPYKMLHRIT